MKKYEEYIVEDFIQDLYFREWVLEGRPEAAQFWNTWVMQNPDKKATVEQAKSMVLALTIKEIDISEADIQHGIDRILTLTEPAEIRVVPMWQQSGFRIAATIALIVSVGLWWINTGKNAATGDKNASYTEGVFNKEEQPVSVTFPDGSTVILEKDSGVRYAKDFAGQLREVELTGQGLFDVVKNPDKPFVVYAGNVTTKVLGTSFIIKSFAKDSNVTVNVIRGRVSVAADKKEEKKATEKQEVILVPNQMAVFSKKEERLAHTISEKPIVVVPQQLVFEEASISSIFESLEKTYGVEIVFNKELLKNCALTTTFKDESLFDKLKIICKSIGATSKIEGVQIIVEGQPCQ
jgi:transmembrane sensor